jgi:hypothetical protein
VAISADQLVLVAKALSTTPAPAPQVVARSLVFVPHLYVAKPPKRVRDMT